MSSYPEGWYDDPDVQGQERWWTGEQWTDDVREKQYAPGWYNDPDRFGAERYWDGSAWTSDQRFITRYDEIFQAPSLRKKDWHLIVTGEHLTWGENSIRWDDVTKFDTLTRLMNGSPALYSMTAEGPTGKVMIELGVVRNDNRAAEAFAIVVDQAYRVLTPRMLNELFKRADTGEVLEYEKVSLSPKGFSKGGKDPVPWSEYGGWRSQGPYFEIDKMKGEKTKNAVRVHTTHLGRWILSALVDDYSKRYANG